MGVDTEILINSKWGSRDICDFLNSHFDMEETAKEENTHTPEYTTISFKRKGFDMRTMHYHRETPTPLGNAVLLTLRCNKEAKEIMQAIGEGLGGFYQPNDCEEHYELIRGMLHIHNGLPYFLEHAVLNNKITDSHDLEGLKKYIDEWNEKHQR